MLKKEDILHIADLSKLSFTDRECDLFQKDLNEIIDFASKNSDFSNETTEGTLLEFESLRDDVQKQELSREEILSNTTQSEGGYFSVSKVITDV